jgi:hypothetical protein
VREASVRDFDPPLFVEVGEVKLVTPERRLVLDQLMRTRPTTGPIKVRLASETVTGLYREWALRDARRVAGDLAGTGERMYPVAVAATLVLLLHGADHEDRALMLTAQNRQGAEKLLCQPLTQMAHAIGDRRRARKPKFDGYAITRAQERLGSAVQRHTDRNENARLWVVGEEREGVLKVLAHELIARRDRSLTAALLACEALREAYLRILPGLARMDLRPSATADPDQVIGDLRDALTRVTSS